MTKTRVLILLLLIPSAPFAQTSRARTGGTDSSSKTMIGYVQKEHIIDGCGCSYSFKGKATGTVSSDDLGGGTSG